MTAMDEIDPIIIPVTDKLKFVLVDTKYGPYVTAYDETGERVARKRPRPHPSCLIDFVAQVTKENIQIEIYEEYYPCKLGTIGDVFGV